MLSEDYEFLKSMPELKLCKIKLIELFNDNLVNTSYACNENNLNIWLLDNKSKVQTFSIFFPNSKDSFNYWLTKTLFCFSREGNLSELKNWIHIFNIRDLNIFSEYGNSLLSCACYNNMYHVSSYLVKKGANVNTKNKNGKTALHRIMETEDNMYKEKIFFLLKDNGVKLNYTDKDGNSALHYATEIKNIKYVSMLIKFNPNINVRNKDGLYPIHLCVKNIKENSDLKLFDKIISESNFNIEVLDKYENNLLLYACGQNNYILATHLIKNYKMNINNLSRIKEYILRYVDNNWTKIFRLFLEYFPNLIDISIYNYCKKNNEILAYNILFYFAYNSVEEVDKDNLDGQDPLSILDTHIQRLIMAQ